MLPPGEWITVEFEEKEKERVSLKDSGKSRDQQRRANGAQQPMDVDSKTAGAPDASRDRPEKEPNEKMDVEEPGSSTSANKTDKMDVDKPQSAEAQPDAAAPQSARTDGPAQPKGEADSTTGDKAAKKPKKVRIKEVNVIACVHVLNRRPAGQRMDAFSKPFIISFDRLTTKRSQVHKMIWERVSMYLAPAELPQLALSLVDLLGENQGESLPNDDELLVIDEATSAIAIDWDRDIVHGLGLLNRREVSGNSIRVSARISNYMDIQEFGQHESMKRTEEDQELTVTLQECLDLYTK